MAIMVKACFRVSDGTEFPYDPELAKQTDDWRVGEVDAEPRILRAQQMERQAREEKIRAAESKLRHQRESLAQFNAQAADTAPAAKPAPAPAPAPDKTLDQMAADAGTTREAGDTAPAENLGQMLYPFDVMWTIQELRAYAKLNYPNLMADKPDRQELLKRMMAAQDKKNAAMATQPAT